MRSLPFLFLGDFEGKANISVAIRFYSIYNAMYDRETSQI